MMYKGKKITFKRIASGIKWRIGSIIFKKLFTLWEKLGFHITRNHFYEPIPDTRMLKDDLWQKPSELVGIDINEESQINLLSMFSSEFKEEYESFPRNKTS